MRFVLPTTVAAAALLLQTSAHAAAAPSETVVFVGGLGSTTLSTQTAFTPLLHELVARGVRGFRPFVYGSSSCQSIQQSSDELAAELEALRAQHAADRVILVGHSNGGVVALGALASAPDLVPFVERVVTVDSPLTGISRSDALGYGAVFGDCPAADELYARSLTPGWPDYLVALEAYERAIGADVRIVVNPSDAAVLPAQQQIPGDAAYAIDATEPDDWSNHAAVLHVPAAAAQLAAIITGD